MRRAAAALSLFLLSCSPASTPGERVLRDLAYEVILPGYRSFTREAELLVRAAEAYREVPDAARREAARSAWKAARRAWVRCAGHFVGPEAGRLLQAKVDTFPASEGKIAQLLASGAAVDEVALEQLGGDVKGFFALEAVLFDDAAPPDPRRREFLVGLARNLARTAQAIQDGWEDGRGGHAARFARSGRAGQDLLINHLVVSAQVLADRIARPAGLTTSAEGRSNPALAVARRSGHTLEDALGTIEGIRRLYEGSRPGMGLAAKVAAASPELDREIRAALEAAWSDLSALPRPIDVAIASHPEPLRKATGSLRVLQNRIAIDLASAYRTTLTVSPFDGD